MRLAPSRRARMLSHSSMKSTHGACACAQRNTSAKLCGASPTQRDTRSATDTEMIGSRSSAARACASTVLPLPGAPCSRMPFRAVGPVSRQALPASSSARFRSEMPSMAANPDSAPTCLAAKRGGCCACAPYRGADASTSSCATAGRKARWIASIGPCSKEGRAGPLAAPRRCEGAHVPFAGSARQGAAGTVPCGL